MASGFGKEWKKDIFIRKIGFFLSLAVSLPCLVLRRGRKSSPFLLVIPDIKPQSGMTDINVSFRHLVSPLLGGPNKTRNPITIQENVTWDFSLLRNVEMTRKI
jgi:hypothetical protein